jgi:very-short-patch-repair endonuclease
MLLRWKNPDYRKEISEKVSATVKSLWRAGKYCRIRPDHSVVMKRKWKEFSYAGPLLALRRSGAFRRNMAEKSRELWKNEDYARRNSQTRIRNWKKASFRDKYKKGHLIGARKRVDNPEFLKRVAKACAKHPNESEKVLIKILGGLRVSYKFQPQLLGFIPDFIVKKKLVVECDGKYWHSLPEVVERDGRKRRKFLKAGYRLLRLDSAEVRKNPILAKAKILRALERCS